MFAILFPARACARASRSSVRVVGFPNISKSESFPPERKMKLSNLSTGLPDRFTLPGSIAYLNLPLSGSYSLRAISLNDF